MRPLLPVLLMIALPAAAETPMTGAAFDDYATGKTLTYDMGGQVWGQEQYLPDRRVIWSQGGECQHGLWYQQADAICFLYDGGSGPQCWRFFTGATGLTAVFQGTGDAATVSETGQTDRPLSCAPEVGV